MKILLTVLVLIVSTMLDAQDNSAANQNSHVTAKPATSNKKNVDKKVHYVDKRTQPDHNKSNGSFNSQANKKPVVRKAEKQEKVVLK